MVSAAVGQNGYALQFADRAMKNHKEVVRVAVDNRRTSLRYATRALRRDPSLRRMGRVQARFHLRRIPVAGLSWDVIELIVDHLRD